jgi:hypothetical protein
MSIPLRDLAQRDMFMDGFQKSVIGVRCGSDLVFGKPVYHECGRPAGYYLECGAGISKKSIGPLSGSDVLEYVDGRRI